MKYLSDVVKTGTYHKIFNGLCKKIKDVETRSLKECDIENAVYEAHITKGFSNDMRRQGTPTAKI